MTMQKNVVVRALIVGSPKVGKTSYLQSLYHSQFTHQYFKSISLSIRQKSFTVDQKEYTLKIFDNGDSSIKNKTSDFKNSDAVIFAFDTRSIASFQKIEKLADEVHNYNPAIRFLLISTKHDLDNNSDNQVTSQMISNFTTKYNHTPYFVTSAKDSLNIQQSAIFLIRDVIKNKQKEVSIIISNHSQVLSKIEKTKCCK